MLHSTLVKHGRGRVARTAVRGAVIGSIAASLLLGLATATANAAAVAAAADAGYDAYMINCSSCHGASLAGVFGPALNDAVFAAKWRGKSAAALRDYIQANMPPTRRNGLPLPMYAAITEFLIKAGRLEFDPALPSAPTPARNEPAAAPADKEGGPRVVQAADDDPIARAHRDKLAVLGRSIRPVTDASLHAPADADWPTWRRSQALAGYSPLTHIDVSNAHQLVTAWALSFTPGTNGIEPLVQDGVLFINVSGAVQALDATNGDLLWEYNRPAINPVALLTQPRGMTLYGGALYVPTIDNHLLALDSHTGKLLWDHEIAKLEDRLQLTGAPLAARGKIMQGVSGCFMSYRGGCFIVGLDAGDGHEVWRFYGIARPGQPGGDSWNGAALEDRYGGSIWAGGSYDPDLNLAYFGIAQTYKVSTLLGPGGGTGQSKDALYTDSTVALDPDSGRLVWYYQHVAGDVWDLDWAFEQTLMTLPVDGRARKVVMTAGKIGLLDVLDARTGRYLWSQDFGVQSLVTAIDAKSGHKSLDPRLLPSKEGWRTVCPSMLGGRNWLATSLDPQRHLLYMPLVETCMDIGLTGTPSAELKYAVKATAGADGNFGRVAALDLVSRKIIWTNRRRAPPASAMLATGGGVVFEGSRDRWFRALDGGTGAVLWKVRLDDTPNSFPISYAVDGRQYVAVVTGGNTQHDIGLSALTPEIRSSPGGRTLWVFALPVP